MAKRYKDNEGTRGMLFCSFCGKTQNEVKKLGCRSFGIYM